MKLILIVQLLLEVNYIWCFKLLSWGNWTWISGSKLPGQHGSYTKIGVASPYNYPGARVDHSMVKDSSRQLIYTFGGVGYIKEYLAAGNSFLYQDFVFKLIRLSE